LFYQKKDYLFLLPFIIIFWVNLDLGFIFGILIFILFILNEVIKRKLKLSEYLKKQKLTTKKLNYLILIFFITLIFSFFNPNSYKIYQFTFSKYFYSNPFSDKLYQLKFIHLNYHQFSLYSFLVLIFFIIISNFKELNFKELFICSIFIFLCVYSKNFFPFLAITSSILLSDYFSRFDEKFKNIGLFLKNKILISYIFLILTTILFIFLIIKDVSFSKVAMTKFFPYDAINFIKKNKIRGKIYNNFIWGDFLIFKLYPKYKVSVDTRLNDAYKKGYLEKCFLLENGVFYWKEILEKLKVNFIILPKNTKLLKNLSLSDDWIKVYQSKNSCCENHKAVIFIKNTFKNEYITKKHARVEYESKTASKNLYKGYLLLRENKLNEALKILKETRRLVPENLEVRSNIATIYIRFGDLEKAIDEIKKILEEDQSHIPALLNLAYIYSINKEYDDAIKVYEKILKIKPDNKIAEKVKKAIKKIKKNQK
jgi:tetratricopeptide (TPR) repeat protein